MSEEEAETDRKWMREALSEARAAAELGEVPVGALIVRENEVLARGFNRREVDSDPLGHAEVLAIRGAAEALGDWRLEGCTLYVTLEPCAMCAGALVNSRVERLVFGATDPKGGYCRTLGNLVQDPRLNHQLQMSGGVLAAESAELLKGFFRGLRRR